MRDKGVNFVKRRLLLTLLPLTVLLFFAAFAVTPVKGEGTGASVWTDKPNYTLGKTVTISGSGFSANTQVTISIETVGEEIDERSAITNDAGDFTYQYQLGGIAGTYTVTATDGKQTAPTASFTVSEPFYISIDRINGNSPPFPSLTSPIHLEGSASALDFPGELSDYSVQVDWGDGTKTTDTSDVKFVQSGQDFSGNWSSLPDHEYATSGLWRIQVKLYHGTPPGSGPGDAEASAWAQVEVGVIRIGIMINTTTSPTCLNLVVDGANYTAPWTFEWTMGSLHSIGATSPQLVSAGMRYSWTRWSDNGAIIHDIVVPSTSTTYTAYFTAQYYLSVESSPGTSSGTGWYDNTSTVYASLTDGSLSGGTGIRYVFTGWSGDASGTDLISGPIIMDGPKTATANWKTQYLVSFDQTGSAGTPIVNYGIDTGSTTAGAVPFDVWVDSGQQISYAYEAIVSGDPGVRHPLIGVSPASPQTVTGPLTIVGTYKTQFKVTFDQTGIGTDFTGTVVTIDSVDYVLTIPLAEFWWDKGSAHDFAFRSPLSVETDKQYVWTKTTGLSSSQSDTLTITGAGSVIGNYKTQWLQTFDASSNVKSDGTGTIVTVDDSPVLLSDLIFAIWIDDGLTVTFVYESIVSSTANCKQYSLTGVTGPLSGYKVSSSNTIFGNYVTQWLVTVELSGIEADFAGAIVRIDGSDYSSVPQLFWWDSGSTHTFEFQSALVVEPTAKRYVLVNVDHASPLMIMESMTLSATYKTQYYLIVDSTHGVTGGQGWYDESDTARAVVTPLIVSGPEGIRYVFAEWSSDATGTTSPSDPITMNRAKTATANWKTQYYLTVDSTCDTPTPMSGWFDADTEITASVTSPWPQDVTDTRYVCTGWRGTGSVPPTGTDTSVIFTVSGPSSITWNWKTQYYMTLETSPQGITTPCGAGWYDVGT
nr:hypothetical protein [Candidatus Njordarchaeum guaymaensis]